jgi:hypothetical protein
MSDHGGGHHGSYDHHHHHHGGDYFDSGGWNGHGGRSAGIAWLVFGLMIIGAVIILASR